MLLGWQAGALGAQRAKRSDDGRAGVSRLDDAIELASLRCKKRASNVLGPREPLQHPGQQLQPL